MHAAVASCLPLPSILPCCWITPSVTPWYSFDASRLTGPCRRTDLVSLHQSERKVTGGGCEHGALQQRAPSAAPLYEAAGICVLIHVTPCRCCAAGTYSPVVGALSSSTFRISDCGSGKYAGGPGASACSDCQAGEVSTDCSPRACLCHVGVVISFFSGQVLCVTLPLSAFLWSSSYYYCCTTALLLFTTNTPQPRYIFSSFAWPGPPPLSAFLCQYL
jgi:hypothetical protein